MALAIHQHSKGCLFAQPGLAGNTADALCNYSLLGIDAGSIVPAHQFIICEKSVQSYGAGSACGLEFEFE